MKYITLILLSLATLLLTQNSIFVKANSNDLIISEINYAGSINGNCKTDSTATNRCSFDKWVEIFNQSSNAVNLAGYKLVTGDGATQKFETISLTGTIVSGGYYLVGNSEVNFNSAVNGFNLTNYNIKNISNKTSQTIGVSLQDNLGNILDNVQMSSAGYAALQTDTARHTLERSGNGSWYISNNAFRAANYGTPGFGILSIKAPEIAKSPEVVITPVITEPVTEVVAIPQVNQPDILAVPENVIASEPQIQPATVSVVNTTSQPSVQTKTVESPAKYEVTPSQIVSDQNLEAQSKAGNVIVATTSESSKNNVNQTQASINSDQIMIASSSSQVRTSKSITESSKKLPTAQTFVGPVAVKNLPPITAVKIDTQNAIIPENVDAKLPVSSVKASQEIVLSGQNTLTKNVQLMNYAQTGLHFSSFEVMILIWFALFTKRFIKLDSNYILRRTPQSKLA